MSFPITDVFKSTINNARDVRSFISHSSSLVRTRIFLISASAFFTLAAAGECRSISGNVVRALIYTALGILALIFDTALMYFAEAKET